MNFANNIKAIRKEHHLSQEQLAEQLGVSRQSVSKWESGQSYPEMDKILLLCKLFDCDIGVLMNENFREASETKQQKTRLNKAIEDFFEYITRFVALFAAMTLRQKLKCFFEQVCVIAVLALLCVLALALFNLLTHTLFEYSSALWVQGIVGIFRSLFLAVIIIAAITVLLHVFKIRYLDYYDLLPPEAAENEDTAKQPENAAQPLPAEQPTAEQPTAENPASAPKPLFSKKRERIIIRDPKHSSSRFLMAVMKTVVLLLKVLFGLVGLCVAIAFAGTAALLVTSVLIAKSGWLFVGVFLTLLALLSLLFVTLRLIYNFLTSRKSRKAVTAVLLLLALIVSGGGVGLTLVGASQFSFVNTPLVEKTEFTVPMRDKLTISSYFRPVNYVETNSDTVKISVIHSRYAAPYLNEADEAVYVSANETIKSFDKLRALLQDINRKQLNEYLFDGPPINVVTVYSSKTNLAKLQENDHIRFVREEEIRNLYEQIQAMELTNTKLQIELAEKESLIEELRAQIDAPAE